MRVRVTKKAWWLLLLLVPCAAVALFLLTRPAEPEPKSFPALNRAQWIARASSYLEGFAPSLRTPVAKTGRDVEGGLCYTIRHEGILRFPDGGWVYVITRPAEADGTAVYEGRLTAENPIGSVVLAVDHRGRVWESAAPVPDGALTIPSPTGKPFAGVDAFLAAPAGDGCAWTRRASLTKR